jgi:hypothetical protein
VVVERELSYVLAWRIHSFSVGRVIWTITQDTPPCPSSTTFDHNSNLEGDSPTVTHEPGLSTADENGGYFQESILTMGYTPLLGAFWQTSRKFGKYLCMPGISRLLPTVL